jgi:hypothetical protein
LLGHGAGEVSHACVDDSTSPDEFVSGSNGFNRKAGFSGKANALDQPESIDDPGWNESSDRVEACHFDEKFTGRRIRLCRDHISGGAQ